MVRERYFTPETIQAKSRELLAHAGNARRRREPLRILPGKIALLVLDMQAYFLQEDSHAFIPSAPAIVGGISRMASIFIELDLPVIFTRHINTPEDAGMMSVWWRDMIEAQSAYSHIINKLNTSTATIIDKPQYDAFFQTALEETLREQEVEQVVICGVMTHLCCETTARSAFMRGFEVFFAVDGTATYNEELHRASLLTLSHGFATPVLVDEILTALELV